MTVFLSNMNWRHKEVKFIEKDHLDLDIVKMGQIISHATIHKPSYSWLEAHGQEKVHHSTWVALYPFHTNPCQPRQKKFIVLLHATHITQAVITVYVIG